MAKQASCKINFFLMLSFMMATLITGGCAVVHDAPQSSTTYQTAEHEGQVPRSTYQELEKQYPPDFWQERKANIPESDRIKIGVKGFGNTGYQQNLEKMITESLTTALVKSEIFIVVERQQLEKVVNELELNQSGIIDAATAKEVGHILGVDIILTGSISQVGADQRIDARVIDISTGRVVVAEKLNCHKIDNQNINILARRLINRIADKYYNK